MDQCVWRDRAARGGVGGQFLTGTSLSICYVEGHDARVVDHGLRFLASVLPVWLLLAPRDYLSTFMKIGTVMALGVAVIVVRRR